MHNNHHTVLNSTPQDFINYINNYSIKDTETGCWNWTGHITEKGEGYGQLRFYGETAYANRVSYWAFKDNTFKVLKNRVQKICHTCDNKKCVNPEHLFLGNNEINIQDYYIKKNGHIKASLDVRIRNRIAVEKYREKNKPVPVNLKLENFKLELNF